MLLRRESWLKKVLRLGSFLLFVQLLVTALIVRSVHAEVQDLMLSVGAQMMKLGEQAVGRPRTLRINGAQIRLRVDRAPNLTLAQVLDHFEAVCRSRNGRFYEQLTERKPKVKLGKPQLEFLDGVMRVDGDGQGSVACLDVGDERGSPATLLERAKRFSETGDASSFGDLRYVRAEQREQGVFVVMMWTDGPLNIKRMFPKSGDAPGIDFPSLPRPPGGRRILSAWEEGQAPALSMYEVPNTTAAQLDQHYRTLLPKLGWDAMTPPSGDTKEPVRGMLAMRAGHTVTLSHGSLDDGKHGVTTIVPMDTAGATNTTP